MPTTTPGDRDFFDGVPDGIREVAAAAVTTTQTPSAKRFRGQDQYLTSRRSRSWAIDGINNGHAACNA
jgi:hypothetical protein